MDEKEKVVKKKRAFDFSLLIAIVLFLISLGMAGLFSWAIAGFRTNVLQDEAFWFSLVISVIINFFSLMASVTYFLPKKSKTDESVKEREDALFKFNLTTDATQLEQFVISTNDSRKKKAYIRRVSDEKRKFVKKYNPSMIDRKTWYSGTPEQKEKNEYCLKLMEYEELISEEYIKENLLYIDVKYERITTAMIISEAASMKDGELTLHRGIDKTFWWVWRIVPRYLANSSLAVAWAVFFIQMANGIDLYFWLDFMVRLVGMIMNISTGIYLVNSYVKTIVLSDLDVRLSLARQFVIWSKRTNEPVL